MPLGEREDLIGKRRTERLDRRATGGVTARPSGAAHGPRTSCLSPGDVQSLPTGGISFPIPPLGLAV